MLLEVRRAISSHAHHQSIPVFTGTFKFDIGKNIPQSGNMWIYFIDCTDDLKINVSISRICSLVCSLFFCLANQR